MAGETRLHAAAPRTSGAPVADKSPAQIHLELANSYLDDAQAALNSAKTPSTFIVERTAKPLSKAADHLNKAREIDPNEFLWVESDEDKAVRLRFTQDIFASRILLCEGVAALNAAHAINTDNDTYRLNHGRADRSLVRTGNAYLISARDALEKSLKFSVGHKDTLKFLTQTYRELGEKDKYKRLLEKRIELYPDDIAAHKELDQIDDPDFLSPLFTPPPTISINVWLAISMVVGFILFPIAAQNKALGLFAIILLFGPPAIWWYRWKNS
jgi:tetratricopeptide (TPR) repeat protein